jgi:hypothetical protein
LYIDQPAQETLDFVTAVDEELLELTLFPPCCKKLLLSLEFVDAVLVVVLEVVDEVVPAAALEAVVADVVLAVVLEVVDEVVVADATW